MGWLERVAVTASLQRAGHQVAEIDVGRRDVRRQGQFELRLGRREVRRRRRRALERADHVNRSPVAGVDQLGLRRTPFEIYSHLQSEIRN